MSMNRLARPGVETTADQREKHQLGKTVERQVGADERDLTAPQMPDIEKAPSLTSYLGPPPDEDAVPRGFGPRLVILDGFVNGPGSLRGHSRGDVIWASDLLGGEFMKEEEDRAKATLRYYMDNKSVREATPEERYQTTVTFLQGEDQMADALVNKSVENSALRDENASLRAQIELLQQGKSPQEVDRALKGRNQAPAVVGRSKEDAVGDNAIL